MKRYEPETDGSGEWLIAVMTDDAAGEYVRFDEAQAEIERLKVSHARYETLRKLNVVQFQALYTKSLQSPIPFDELVDMLGVQS